MFSHMEAFLAKSVDATQVSLIFDAKYFTLN